MTTWDDIQLSVSLKGDKIIFFFVLYRFNISERKVMVLWKFSTSVLAFWYGVLRKVCYAYASAFFLNYLFRNKKYL